MEGMENVSRVGITETKQFVFLFNVMKILLQLNTVNINNVEKHLKYHNVKLYFIHKVNYFDLLELKRKVSQMLKNINKQNLIRQ